MPRMGYGHYVSGVGLKQAFPIRDTVPVGPGSTPASPRCSSDNTLVPGTGTIVPGGMTLMPTIYAASNDRLWVCLSSALWVGSRLVFGMGNGPYQPAVAG